MPLRIGTRGSELALWQAHRTQKLLLDLLCVHSEIIVIKTQGDVVQNIPLSQLDGKGFFTKEIEDALLAGTIDLAIHSLKDLPTQLPAGLTLGAIPERATCHDRLICNPAAVDKANSFFLKDGSVLGTSSNRRIDQVKQIQPDLNLKMLRGNVPTRVQKLRNGEYDAIILAGAGLDRLNVNLTGLEVFDLDPKWFVSAPAQGALGIEIREDDEKTADIIGKLHDHDIARFVAQERKFLRLTEGGCHASVGSHGWTSGSRTYLSTYWHDGNSSINLQVGDKDPDSLAEKAFSLHKKIREKQPGLIWIARDESKSLNLKNWLEISGKTVICQPVIETRTLKNPDLKDEIQKSANQSDWMVLTSQAAIIALQELKFVLPEKLKIAVIGPETLKATEKAGWIADLISQDGNSSGMAESWTDQVGLEGTVFYPASILAGDEFAEKLILHGWKVHQIPVYETCQVALPDQFLDGKNPDFVVVYSASSVEPVASILKKRNPFCKWISIGPATSAEIRKQGFEPFFEAAYPEPAELLPGMV